MVLKRKKLKLFYCKKLFLISYQSYSLPTKKYPISTQFNKCSMWGLRQPQKGVCYMSKDTEIALASELCLMQRQSAVYTYSI